MTATDLLESRHRTPLHWKCAVSARKRWHRLRRCWRVDRDLEEVRYFGATFQVDRHDLIGHEVMLKRYEWFQIPKMLRACRALNPAAFIDVGANLGLYTCIIGRQNLAKRLVAFEPDRKAFARLQTHIKLNGLTAVELHSTGVGAMRHTAALLPASGGNSGVSAIVAAHPQAYEVEVVTLDDTIPLVGQPLAIKIDVEGYELAVLDGAKNLLTGNYGYAQIEAFNDRVAAVVDKMAQLGWRLCDRVHADVMFRRTAP